MTTEDLDIAAFPVAVPERWSAIQDGMGLRDWFAGQALAAITERQSYLHASGTPALIAEQAYIIAQAMLVQRQKYEENSQ